MAERQLTGTGAAPGVAIGQIVRYQPAAPSAQRTRLSDDAVPAELARLRRAIEQARGRIEQARDAALRSAGPQEAAIFDSHLLMLDDPAFSGEVFRLIREERQPAERALSETTRALHDQFASLGDSYLRERFLDVEDVGAQIGRILAEAPSNPLAEAPSSAIVVARELLLSDTALFDPTRVVGLVTERGTRTAHTAILARALGVPMVVGVADALARISGGERAIVDGDRGELIVDPDPATLAGLESRLVAQEQERQRWHAQREVAAMTTDGVRVRLLANIGELEEVELALANGAEGVGLLRSEFLFQDRPSLPSEEEQYAAYRHVLELMGPNRPVTIRTLDPDRDKPLPGIDSSAAHMLGALRGLRLARRYPAIFVTQIRALLRAGTAGRLRILLPMVATRQDIRFARAAIERARDDLQHEGVPHASGVPVGIMVEIPAAAIAADLLIRESDFFSIGSNDLVQYTLAADRADERLAGQYHPLDVAVLRLILKTIEAARAAGKPATICGELAGEPAAVGTLLGLGARKLSISPMSIPRIKDVIQRLDSHDCSLEARRRLAGDEPE